MKFQLKYSVRLGIICLCLAALTGCATVQKKAPIYANPNFKAQSVGEITLLPVVDGRIDKSIHLNLEKYVRHDVKLILVKDKHYRVRLASSSGMGEKPITEADLRAADPAWIKTLGPVDARWTMVVILDQFSHKVKLFGESSGAELSAALFDKKKGIVLWRDNGTGRWGTGGLLGRFYSKADELGALASSEQNLLASFPKRTDTK